MTYASEVLADSPLGYWRLNEPSGTSMVDSSPNGRNGTYSGATLNQSPLHAGNTASALGTATGQGIGSVPSATWMNWGSTFTVEFWVKPNTTGDAVGLVSRFASVGWVVWQRRGRLGFTIVNGSQQDKDGYTFTVGQITHVAIVFTPSAASVYVNGILSWQATIGGALQDATTSPLQIGGYGGSNQSAATMSDVAVYGTALSAARIAAHYGISPFPAASKDPATVAGLVARWDASAITGKTDGQTVTSWPDLVGSHPAVSIGAGKDPLYRTGILNGKPVVRFDGADDSLKAASVLANDTSVTVISVLSVRSITGAQPFVPWAFQTGNGGIAMAVKNTTGQRSLFSVGNYVNYGGGVYTAGTFERWSVHADDVQAQLYVNAAFSEFGSPLTSGGTDMNMAQSPTQGFITPVDLAEMLVYDRALTSYEIAGVDAYLAAKWFTPPSASNIYDKSGAQREAYRLTGSGLVPASFVKR